MPKLLEQALDQMRTLHYCYRTEQPYLHWIKQFILYHGNRHPRSVPKTSATSLLTLQSSAPSQPQPRRWRPRSSSTSRCRALISCTETLERDPLRIARGVQISRKISVIPPTKTAQKNSRRWIDLSPSSLKARCCL